MKIDKTTGAGRPARVDKARDANAPSSGARRVAQADEVSVLGVPDAELTPKVRAALISLIEDVRDLRDELGRARARIDELETLADRDPMLDVLNRRAFARELDRAFAMIDRYQFSASLLIIDLNDLKIINDQRGHTAGDAALEHVAAALTSNVRQTDVVARIGGDEFAVLLMQADEAVAREKAKTIETLIAGNLAPHEGGDFAVSISWGAVEIRQGLSAQDAINLADQAMYAAKKNK